MCTEKKSSLVNTPFTPLVSTDCVDDGISPFHSFAEKCSDSIKGELESGSLLSVKDTSPPPERRKVARNDLDGEGHEVVGENWDANCSAVSGRFSNISNGAAASNGQLSTPRHVDNVVLDTCIPGVEENNLGETGDTHQREEEFVHSGDEPIDGAANVSEHRVDPIALPRRVEELGTGPCLVSGAAEQRGAVEDSEKGTERKGPNMRKPMVQYSARQTERIRAQESEVRKRNREQRRRARLGLQAQEARERQEAVTVALPSPKTPSCVGRQTCVSRTRSRLVYDGVPSSAPGASAQWQVEQEEEEEVECGFPTMEWKLF